MYIYTCVLFWTLLSCFVKNELWQFIEYKDWGQIAFYLGFIAQECKDSLNTSSTQEQPYEVIFSCVFRDKLNKSKLEFC